MATNRDLLKEAIADAKAVKEMAIANAKAALEEAFTPQLKSMLATKLQEMEEMDEEVEEMEEGKMAMYDEDDTEAMKEEEVEEELDLDELLAELDEAEEDEDMMNEAEEEAEEDMESETEEETLDLEDMSEEDLKSFIEDVIADMVEAGDLEAGEGEEGEEEEDEEMETEEEEEVNIDELLAEIDSMDEEEELEEAGFGKMSADSDEGFSDMEEKALDEEEDLEEIFGLGKKGSGGTSFLKSFMKANADEIEAAKGDKEAGKKLVTKFYNENIRKMDSSALRSDISVLRKEIGMGELGGGSKRTTQLEADLSEALETIETLRSELNEVNLLNAKLLYTNKIFKGKNLTESQKVKVLETFDKASTVKEVKLVYETLNEGVKTNKKPISENLGSASKAMGTTKKPIINENDAFARMREIAFYSQTH